MSFAWVVFLIGKNVSWISLGTGPFLTNCRVNVKGALLYVPLRVNVNMYA